MNSINSSIFLVAILFLISACGEDDPDIDPVRILSLSCNGATLENGTTDLDPSVTIEIVFSSTLDPSALRSELIISSASGNISIDPLFTNQASRVVITADLDYSSTYTLKIGTNPIGAGGEQLEQGLFVSFTTRDDGMIHTMSPCTMASTQCLHSINLEPGKESRFSFYSSFPVYEDKAEWTEITAAVVVVHGASRNPDDYFNYVMGALQAAGLEESVVLIAPFYKNEVEASSGDLYWSGTKWREGANSVSDSKVSSYSVLDTIIGRLADKDHFPVLEKVFVTGQSSGGCFTHLFSAVNSSESVHTGIDFEYIVGESQYFYYPDGSRINESNNQLYTPNGCTGYDIWPFGYNVVPSVLSQVSKETYDYRFVHRSVIYFLGNGDKVDGSLNTTDCSATLLGSTRYRRGKNMYRYMELQYPGVHNHRVVEVDGVTHDGSAMYGSEVFSSLLNELLEL